jgi:hypothetical protein
MYDEYKLICDFSPRLLLSLLINVCLYVYVRDLYDLAISDNNLKLNYRFNLNFNLIYYYLSIQSFNKFYNYRTHIVRA